MSNANLILFGRIKAEGKEFANSPQNLQHP